MVKPSHNIYLQAIRKAGGKVNRTVVQSAAFGILRRKAPHLHLEIQNCNAGF